MFKKKDENKPSMLTEFKEFAMKGNVIDLAVGMVVGTAFGAIVTSLVKDIIMPIASLLSGNIDFTNLQYVKTFEVAGKVSEIKLTYGNFLQAVFNFLIVAFAIFMVVKLMNKAKAKMVKEEAEKVEEVVVEPTKEEVLLAEIRDLLKKQAK